MVPTLSAKGDWIYISKWYRRGRGIHVGDLVDFEHPMVPGMGAVKRVVGMPGDFVMRDTIKSGQMEDLGRCKMIQVRYRRLLIDNRSAPVSV